MNYNFRDRTGEKYGKLTVLERDTDAIYKSGKLVRWKCICNCGNVKSVIGSNLAKTKSCGCDMYGHNIEDLTGQRFGILTVIKRVESKTLPCGQNQTMWQCVCDCGSVVNVRAATLKNGDTRSCGCIKSHGERLVSECLNSLHIKYIREFSFDDLVNSKGNKLRFDFAVLDSNDNVELLIEYQGEQHYYTPERNSYFGEIQRNETDALKKDYCLTHNYPLYEIKYDDDIQRRIEEILHDNTVPSLLET